MPYTPIDTSGQREFIGWFTEAEGGTQVTTSTVYQIEGNTTYYAHWKEKSDGPFKIYGKVTNANVTDEPLQNVSVRLVQGSANNVIGTATTDKDGNYVIENVPKGDDYFISFLSPINAVLPNQWDGRQLGTVDTDLEVNWQFIVYPVYLHITAKHEPTVPNDKITLTITDTNTTVVEEIQEGQIHSIKTVNVPMSYTIKAEDDRGNSKVVTQNLTETTEVTIILTEETQETGHTIYGTIKDRNTGTVISGMVVELWDTINNRKITETKTDSQGYYSFGDLADGQYDVVAVPDDTSISEVRQTVEISGEDEQVNLYVGLGAVNNFVDKIVVRSQTEFEWYINIDGNAEKYIAENCPKIHNEPYRDRAEKTKKLRDSSYYNIFRLHIGFDEVRAFKKRFGKFIRQNQWKDTDVVVYMR